MKRPMIARKQRGEVRQTERHRHQHAAKRSNHPARRVDPPAVITDHAKAEHHLADRLAASHRERRDVAERKDREKPDERNRRQYPQVVESVLQPGDTEASGTPPPHRFRAARANRSGRRRFYDERWRLHQRGDRLARPRAACSSDLGRVRNRATRPDRAWSYADGYAAFQASSDAQPAAVAPQAAAPSASLRMAAPTCRSPRRGARARTLRSSPIIVIQRHREAGRRDRLALDRRAPARQARSRSTSD